MIARRHLKYIKSTDQTNEERQMMIKNALEYYNSLIKCIYTNRNEENVGQSSVQTDQFIYLASIIDGSSGGIGERTFASTCNRFLMIERSLCLLFDLASSISE